MNGIGLVLAGGGGKGAYQIGVWKYLRETGLDRNICAVSGTSVGALNAALFASGDYERAERIWKNIKPEVILSPPSYTAENVQKWMAESGIAPLPAGRKTPSPSELAPAMAERLGGSLPFSREGLLQLMREGVDFEAIQNASIPCYATCLAVETLEVRRFDLRRLNADGAQTVLLASSAIPVVFDNVEFQGVMYCDGGVPYVGDNTPIAPIARMDVRYILVVHLSQEVLLDHSRYPGVRLIEIMPRTDLGSLVTGTLDFTAEGAAWRMEQGYEDTRRTLGGFVEAARIHRQNELIFQAFDESERKYQDRIAMLKAQAIDTLDRENYEELLEESAAGLPDIPEGMEQETWQEGGQEEA